MSRDAKRSGRGLGGTVHRHGLLLVATFAVITSAGMIFSPLLGRSYRVRAEMAVAIRRLEAIPELERVPEAAVKELAPAAVRAGVEIGEEKNGEGATIRFAASAPTYDGGAARVRLIAEQAGLLLRHRAEELVSAYRSDLGKRSDQLDAREESLGKEIETFRLAHRGALPDDPTSIIAQFEKLATRLDDKQQRQRVVEDQLGRLAAYKKNGGAMPAPIAAISSGQADGVSVAPRAESDPEVLSLTAQIQLVNDQLDDQLNNKHRTEQHPYVVDLRTQQAALQNKLDAAKARVAAGQPPPPTVNINASKASAGNESTAINAQAVDLQIQSLEAERDTLDADIRGLTAQQEGMRKQVDEVLPVRQEYEKLTGLLEAARKEHHDIAASIAQFDRGFSGDAQGGTVTTEAAIFTADSALPAFPRIPLVFGFCGAVGAAATAAMAWILCGADRALHSVEQAAAVLDVPILGMVQEIRPRGAEARARLWRAVVRPAFGIVLIGLTAESGVLCYRHLADAGFSQRVRDRGLRVILSDARETWTAKGRTS